MTELNLNQIFQNPYSIEKWKQFLFELFPNNREEFITPNKRKEDDKKKHESAEQIWNWGELNLKDKSKILFYEVELKQGKKQIARNRVELRNLIHQDVIPGHADGILAVYYSKGSPEWRMSFISKSLRWDEDNNIMIKDETNPHRYTYVFGPHETIRTAMERFLHLFSESRKQDLVLDDLVKAFSVEKVTRKFFSEYKRQFEAFSSHFIDQKLIFGHFLKAINDDDKSQKEYEAKRLTRNFAKKLMGRIVFLYFLQKKGWMGAPSSAEYGKGMRNFMGRLH